MFFHIQKKISRSLRKQVEKKRIKHIIDSEKFVKIKYVGYADDFIIGVKGFKELAVKVYKLVKTFLFSNLSLN